MSRKNKNIIMCLILVLLIVSLCFTIYKIKSSTIDYGRNKMDFGNMERREFPKNEVNQFDKNNRNNNNNENNEEYFNEKQDNNSKNQQEDELNQNEKKSDEVMRRDVKPRNDRKNFMINKKRTVSPLQYIIVGIEALGISIVALYLILTHFNEKGFKDIVKDKDNIIIFVLAAIIITGSIIFGSKYIVKSMQSNEYPEITILDEDAKTDKTINKYDNNSFSDIA